MSRAEDLAVVMLKFHPVCYFHVFVAGMLLARVRQLALGRGGSGGSSGSGGGGDGGTIAGSELNAAPIGRRGSGGAGLLAVDPEVGVAVATEGGAGGLGPGGAGPRGAGSGGAGPGGAGAAAGGSRAAVAVGAQRGALEKAVLTFGEWWGAPLGYGGLLVFFTTPALRPAAAKLSARLSVGRCRLTLSNPS